MKTKKLFVPLFLLFLLPSSHAQTLKEVVRGTVISNPQIQALRLNTKAYRLYVDEERGEYYPDINFEGYFQSKDIERSDNDDRQKTGTNYQLKLEQTLFDGYLIESKVDEAQHDYRLTQYKNFATIDDVVLDAIDAYLNVVKNEEFKLLSENNLSIHEDYLQIAIDAEAVSGDTLDRMQVESKIFSANADYSEVKRDFTQAKATLEKLYGKPLDNNFCRPLVNSLQWDNLKDLTSQVLSVNYDIMEELENIKKQRSIITQEKSRFYPSITARLLHEVDDGVDVEDIKKDENSFRVTLSYNLYNGGQDRAILQREKLFLKEAQKNMDDVVNRVVEDVKVNFSKYHTARKRIEYLEDFLNKKKDIMVVYLEQFEGGTRSFLDILNLEAELFRAKTDLIQEQFTHKLSYYELLNLLSSLSSKVLSSEKQICEEIKVDIEKRRLPGTDDELDVDEDLAAIFDEGGDEQADPNNKDAKVQSMLSQILTEVYSPNMINKNISVSNIRYTEATKELVEGGTLPDEDVVELIKIKQELEEQALREEQDELKKQIKKEAERLATETNPETAKKIKKEIDELEVKQSKVQVSTEKVLKKVAEVKGKQDEIKKLITKNVEDSPLSKTDETPVKAEEKTIKKEESVKALKEDDKVLSLKEQQAQSRLLEEKYKRLFREKNGLDDKGLPKVIQTQKAQSKEALIEHMSDSLGHDNSDAKTVETKPVETKPVETTKNSKAVEQKEIETQKENAQKIREEALKNAEQFKAKTKELNPKKETVAQKKPVEKNIEEIPAKQEAKQKQPRKEPKLSLEQRQAASRELEKMYKAQFREKNGLDQWGYPKDYQGKRSLEPVSKVDAMIQQREALKKELELLETKPLISKNNPTKTVEKQTDSNIKVQNVVKSKIETALEKQKEIKASNSAPTKEIINNEENTQSSVLDSALKIIQEIKSKKSNFDNQESEALTNNDNVKDVVVEEQRTVDKEEIKKLLDDDVKANQESLNKQALIKQIKQKPAKKVAETPKRVEPKNITKEEKPVIKPKGVIPNESKNENKTQKVVPQSSDKIVKSKENSTKVKNSLKDELLGPKSKKYTLGILTLSTKRKASFIKKQYNLKKNLIVYKSQNNGQTYFKVIYGMYDSARDAKADIQNLHKTLQKNGVFVNRISTHQKLFKKYNPNGEL